MFNSHDVKELISDLLWNNFMKMTVDHLGPSPVPSGGSKVQCYDTINAESLIPGLHL